MLHELTPEQATARRWPSATLRQVRALLAKVGTEYVRVSVAKQNSVRWGPYYDATRWRLVVGSRGYPVLRCVSGAASRHRRSLRLAEQDAARTGLPVIRRLDTPDPSRW